MPREKQSLTIFFRSRIDAPPSRKGGESGAGGNLCLGRAVAVRAALTRPSTTRGRAERPFHGVSDPLHVLGGGFLRIHCQSLSCSFDHHT